MLDIIRSNAQSWGVKVAFGLIIIVFVFWGVGSLTGGPEIEVISVNDQIITIQDFQKRYNEIEQNIKQNFPNISEAELKNFQIKQIVTQQLILETLVLQEAKRIGIFITPIELRQAIESFPTFHNTQGIFDPEIYLQFLKAQNENPGRFEAQIRTNILINKLQKEITAGAYIPLSEAYDIYMYESAMRTIRYILFPTEAYINKVTISPEEVAKVYEEYPEQFKDPAEVSLEYLLITPQTLATHQKIDVAAIQNYYDKHIENYTHPELVHVQHIVILAPEKSSPEVLKKAKDKIDQISKLIKKGGDFSKLAKEYSQDNFAKNSGDVGWFSYEQVLPSFASAAFALKPGQISPPIQTPVGYHIIKLLEKKPAGTIPLKEVSKDIQQRLAENSAAEKLQEVLEQIQIALISGKNLEDAGKSYNLLPIKAENLPITNIAKQLDLTKPEDVSILTSTQPGTTLDTPFITKTGYLLAQVKNVKPESTKPLEIVENQISTQLKLQKAKELALKDATEKQPLLKEATIPKDLSKKVFTSPAVLRSGTIENLNNPKLVTDIFKATPGTWLAETYPVEQGVILAYVLEKVDYPSKEQWEDIKDTFITAITKAKHEQMFKGFLSILEKQAKITIKNESILN